MNFQNIPRQDKVIKRAFLPKNDYLLFFDYEQIEYRLLAYYLAEQLGETRMAENFKAGLDPHTETAKLILDTVGIEYDDPMSDFHRQVGKTGNFSIVYAGGTPTIIRQLTRAGWECDQILAQNILDSIKATMPEVVELNEAIYDRLDERGYITTLWGRHLHPDTWLMANIGKRDKRGRKITKNTAYRKMLNALIQGCAADLMRNGLREIHVALTEGGYKAHMVNVVHDEVCIDAPEDEVEALADLIPTCMSYDVVDPIVPITTSMEVSSRSWADKAEYVRSI